MKIKGVKDWEVFTADGKTIKFDKDGIFETDDREVIGFLRALGYSVIEEKKEIKVEPKKPDMKVLDK
jgi:hypothetical protein